MFIQLDLEKDEVLLANADKIIYFGYNRRKNSLVVMLDDGSVFTVLTPLEDVGRLLKTNVGKV